MLRLEKVGLPVRMVLLLLATSSLLVAGCQAANDEAADKVVDESFNLDDNTLGAIMKDFGKQISDMMTNEVEQLVDDTKSKKAPREELDKIKHANKILSKDTQDIIEMAGKKNEGELTQSGLMGDADAGKSLLQQVGGKLHTAGTFIGHQLSSLSGFAPKLSGKLAKVPAQLRKIMHWPTFLKFKIRYNKVYRSLREELYRQMVFLKTQAWVGIHNLKYLCGRVKHLTKATQFADWTDKEYQKFYDNPGAETPESTPEIKKISNEQKDILKKLAESGRTIFGHPAPEAGPTAPDRRLDADDDDDAKLSRKKRDDSELNEDEDEDDDDFKDSLDHFEDEKVSSNSIGVENSGNQDEGLSNELDDSKVIDQFSAQFDDDAGSTDGLDDILDSALSGSNDFEPIDLRKTGCVIEPEDQDSCCACYAFATTAAATYHNCIRSNDHKLVRYSTRFLSDCGRYISGPDEARPKVNGCHGGRVSHAIKFVGLAGTYEFMDYEFARRGMTFLNDKCVYSRPETLENWQPQPNIPPVNVTAYHGVYYANLQLDEIDLHLRTVGPVWVNIRVWEGFKFYAGGIVDSFKESDSTVVHSMLVVGHDKDANGQDYYIIWNSHGVAWGENGFARVYAKSLDYFKVYIGGLVPDTDDQ